MNCLTCGQSMVLSGHFYVCGNHETTVFVPMAEQHNVQSILKLSHIVNVLPTPIAIVYEEYLQEQQPFVKLHRLTDVAEIVTRFFAVVSLSIIYDKFGKFPKSLKRVLVQNISRPTFGSWINITQMS